MKQKSTLALVLILSATILHAQTPDSLLPSSQIGALNAEKKNYCKNDIKINVPGIILFNNYGFSYERMLNHKISITAGLRFMPLKQITATALGRKARE